ncbi:MAG: amidase [Hyphomicrobiaceae bacterium]
MASLEAYQLTVTEAAAAIRERRLTSVDFVEACLDRVKSREEDVQAWSFVAVDESRLDAGLRRPQPNANPLEGVPFGVKDIIEVKDLPTGCGSPIYRNNFARRDAACVALLKEVGGICLGKTVTTELAHLHPGKTRNPHRPSHTPGGSSSGSAAAVAAGMVPYALGTQTTGSVLRPASYCGVFGFKPSFGDVSRSGVMECATSFDTVGWFARCIDDMEIIRKALIRIPYTPMATVALADLTIGLYQGPDWEKASAETQSSIAAAADALARRGVRVQDISTGPGLSELAHHHRVVAGFEFARAITWERTQRGTQLSPKLLEGRCRDGLEVTYEAYASSQCALSRARLDFAEIIAACDVILTPVVDGAAPAGMEATGDPVFNTPWTALHVPAVSIPVFADKAGMPIGLQVVGGHRRDSTTLAAAKAISQSLGVNIVRPVPSA